MMMANRTAVSHEISFQYQLHGLAITTGRVTQRAETKQELALTQHPQCHTCYIRHTVAKIYSHDMHKRIMY